jgi:hypothetical protein
VVVGSATIAAATCGRAWSVHLSRVVDGGSSVILAGAIPPRLALIVDGSLLWVER